MERVLVTGATGFLGRAIVRQLQHDDVAVRCTGRTPAGQIDLPDYHHVDLTSASELNTLTMGLSVIIHAAGMAHQFGRQNKSSEEYFKINRDATRELANAAARNKVRHFVFISSVAVYGSSPDCNANAVSFCQPIGDYARSKWEAENELRLIAEQSGMRITILRLGTLYGEEDPGNVSRLIGAIHRGRFIWIGTGANRKNLLYRDDAARACILAVRRDDQEVVETFDVVGTAITTRELVERITTELLRKVPRLYLPSVFARVAIGALRVADPVWTAPRAWQQTLEKWLRSDVRSNQPFCNRFAFSPAITLEEGIRREVSWYKQEANKQVHNGRESIPLRKVPQPHVSAT